MNILCSSCNTGYDISEKQLRELDNSVLNCSTCKKHIKITFCPHCKSFYSITFRETQTDKYRFTCRNCHNAFIVNFPVTGSQENKKEPVDDYNAPAGEKTKVRPWKTREKREPEKKILYSKTKETEASSGDNKIVFTGETFRNFSLKELFSICSSAFSIKKLIIAFSGILVFMFLSSLYGSIEDSLFRLQFISRSQMIKPALNLVPLLIFFFIYILTSSLIARMTIEGIFFNTKWNLRKTIKFISVSWKSVLFSNIFLLFLASVVLILFGGIPFIGPVLYSIFFLPVYLISLFVVLFVFVSFWFYPPIIAYREIGILKNIRHLYHFIKKHNFTLLYIIPILMISSALVFAALYLLNYAAFYITVTLSSGILDDRLVKIFSAIPFSLLRLADFTFSINDTGVFKNLMGGLFFSHHIGGFIIGLILSGISVLLFASLMSIISTLSSHVYIIMERGIDIDDKKKLRLLFILVLLLIGIVILKKFFI